MKRPLAYVVFNAGAALAQQPASADYRLAPATVDAGGLQAASAAYSQTGSLGGIAGNMDDGGGGLARCGYAGMIFEVTGLTVLASPASIGEGLAAQLSAFAVLDDGTRAALASAEPAWSVSSGPVSVSPAGVVSAGIIHHAAVAVIRGDFAGLHATANLNIADLSNDNFQSYAGDDLPDDWQVDYFGEENGAAGPAEDPDGDGYPNSFEYHAGLNPTDPDSAFHVALEEVPGNDAQRRILFGPCFAGHTYTVVTSADLSAGSWEPLTSFLTANEGTERIVTDLAATGPRRFYRVLVSKP